MGDVFPPWWRVRVVMVTLLLTFASSVGLAQGEVYVCRDRSGAVLFTNTPDRSGCQVYGSKVATTFTPKKVQENKRHPAAFDQDIRRIGKRYNIDPPLIKAIIYAESYFDPRAVSRRGAQGLMQLMPDTARELQVSDPFNPRENIDGGTRYMRYLLDNFNNDLVLSLAAYNAGPGAVKRSGGVPKIHETRRYVNKVLKQYKAYKATW
jgi:soluble lytic murein transglycosylase-like protein